MKPISPSESRNGYGRCALLSGNLASTCCLGLLVLVGLAPSRAWIGRLTQLEPEQPLFIGEAVAALFLAYRRIWRQAADCAPGPVCTWPLLKRGCLVVFRIVVARACSRSDFR